MEGRGFSEGAKRGKEGERKGKRRGFGVKFKGNAKWVK